MKVLVRFFSEYQDFRLQEFESASKAENVKMEMLTKLTNNDIFAIVEFENEQDIKKVAKRCVLVKHVYHVFGQGKDYDELIENLKKLKDETWKSHLSEESRTFKISFDSFNKKFTRDEELDRMNKFKFLPWGGKAKMSSPDDEFFVLEEHQIFHGKGQTSYKLDRVMFALKISDSGRYLLHQYTLKKRKYLGTTSMNETLSFLVANQALCTPKSFVLDPFVGTGSILISCMHFGAHCLGFDIDWRVLKGKEYNMWSNVNQYKFDTSLLIDLVRSDLSLKKTWRFRHSLDAIVGDPPYGIRAGAKKVEHIERIIPEELQKDHIVATSQYDVKDIIIDLIEFAERALKVKGRLIFWYPTDDNFQEKELPVHECFKLIGNTPEKLNSKLTRRLITFEKIKHKE